MTRGVYVGRTFHRKICHGGIMKGAQDFLALFEQKSIDQNYEKAI